MISEQSSYYLTKEDRDYSVKGSRDPLGLQVIWQNQGRKLIPYLSTVSVNLEDFQIICLAYFFYGRTPDKNFISFFLRLEQVMAYARYRPNLRRGFNGIDHVSRFFAEGNTKISISNNSSDQILSNQRAYGIWGKYNRPFRDMGFIKQAAFNKIFYQKVNSLPEKDEVDKIIQKLLNTDRMRLDIGELEHLKTLLKRTTAERDFYDSMILKVNPSLPYQNLLYEYLNDSMHPEEFQLYPFLNSFIKSNHLKNTGLPLLLKETEFTEKTLSPVSRIFRYLQTQPYWEKYGIEKDKFISGCKRENNYVFNASSEEGKVKNHLAQSLSKSNWQLVEDLAKRNADVTGWRGGAPWISIRGDVLDVHFADGGYQNPDYDPVKDADNGYFIDTYINLFRQIKG